MKRKIDRKYELTADEAKAAILYYLANCKDWPVPASYDEAHLTWNGQHDIFITFSEDIEDATT